MESDARRYTWPAAIVAGLAIVVILWDRPDVRSTVQSITASSPSGSSDGSGAVSPDRTPYCGSLAGTPAERLVACLADLPSESPSSAALKEINQVDSGSVLVAGQPLAIKPTQVSLAASPELQKVLLGTDEAAAAKALRDGNIRGFVVHRDLRSALDRDSEVLARLAHHDFLEWFQLRYVSDELLFYTVRSGPARITDTTGELLLAGLRARLEHKTPPAQTWRPDSVRILASIRLQGQTLVMRHATGKDIEHVLDELADKIARRWERNVELTGMGRLEDRLPQARLDVHVVLERATVEPRTRFAIQDLFEVGIDGAMITSGSGDDEKFAYMPGSEAVPRALKSPDAFLQFTAKDGDYRDRRPWEDAKTSLDIIRDDHFMERAPGGGAMVRMTRGAPVVSIDEVTDANARQMLIDGAEWWLHNQYADGSFVYKYWPDQNRYSTEYNEVRHILAARDLAATWQHRHDPRYLEGSRRSMDWLLKFAIDDKSPADAELPSPPAGTLLFRYPSRAMGAKTPNQKLGTVAVAILGWIQWAKATGSHDEDGRILEMAKFVKSMQDDTGRFEPYFVPSGHPYYGQRNDIVPGEAALALGQVGEYFNDPSWMAFFPKFLDYYEPWFTSRAAKVNPYGRWPENTYDNETRLDLVQFGPWSVMASRQYYLQTGDERAAKFGLLVADWMIDTYQWTGARSPWPDYVGGYYKMPTELPAMQTFCYSEGTAAAYGIATKYAPDRKEKYARATAEAIRFMRVMQYDDVDSYAAPRPEVVHGGVKYAMNEGKIRIDYVGHAMSTLAQYLDDRKADPDAHYALTPLEVAAPGSAIAIEAAPSDRPDDAEGDDQSAE